jgi:transposase InsO family protein
MYVTHIPSFGWQCYVPVSVDTYSGFIYASVHAGEATKHVIAHCLAALATMGKPQQFKTDNGPEYASAAFQRFCEVYQTHHTTSIPYNPQGQAIVECAHATLKMQLKKLKGGDEVLPPASQLHKTLYILNFLNCPEQGLTPAERDWQPQELSGLRFLGKFC